MRRTLALVAVVAAALAGSSAGAQSIPNITAAKSAATNAANAANAHTAAVNGTASEKPAASKPAAQPAKPQPAKPQPAKAQPAKAQPASAKPETKPAASKPDAKAAKPDAKAEAKPAPVVEKPDQKAGRSADSVQTIRVGASTNVATRGAASELTFSREIYSYPGRGRRDPFMSLLKSGDLRPLLSDLKLVTVLYDPTGRNSVAILRDLSTKDQYRVKVGQQLGRMRVAQIQPKQLVLTIEEFGYNRQELLALTSDSTRTR